MVLRVFHLALALLCLVPAVVLAIDAPDVFHLVLAVAEIVAAALFLVPRSMVLGGWALIAVLVSALIAHATMGEFAAPLVLYILGVLVVLTEPRP